jgi:hypothetical protein
MLAAAEPGLVDGLLLLSYPLHRRNDPVSYGPRISQASKLPRCWFTARGTGLVPSTGW